MAGGGKLGAVIVRHTPHANGSSNLNTAATLSRAGTVYVAAMCTGRNFDRKERDNYNADASAEAWALTQQFLKQHMA